MSRCKSGLTAMVLDGFVGLSVLSCLPILPAAGANMTSVDNPAPHETVNAAIQSAIQSQRDQIQRRAIQPRSSRAEGFSPVSRYLLVSPSGRSRSKGSRSQHRP
jgi:hypothetical protein